jgi:hypothetical protein
MIREENSAAPFQYNLNFSPSYNGHKAALEDKIILVSIEDIILSQLLRVLQDTLIPSMNYVVVQL